MSSAINHRIKPVAPAELARYRANRATAGGPWCSHSGYNAQVKRVLSCGELPEFIVSYEYRNARLGRVITATRLVCAEHGAAWAKKYGPWDLCSICRRPIIDGKWHDHPCE